MVHITSEYVISKEGVTQADSLSIDIYSITVLPLIQVLAYKWIQNYSNDQMQDISLTRLSLSMNAFITGNERF